MKPKYKQILDILFEQFPRGKVMRFREPHGTTCAYYQYSYYICSFCCDSTQVDIFTKGRVACSSKYTELLLYQHGFKELR